MIFKWDFISVFIRVYLWFPLCAVVNGNENAFVHGFAPLIRGVT